MWIIYSTTNNQSRLHGFVVQVSGESICPIALYMHCIENKDSISWCIGIFVLMLDICCGFFSLQTPAILIIRPFTTKHLCAANSVVIVQHLRFSSWRSWRQLSHRPIIRTFLRVRTWRWRSIWRRLVFRWVWMDICYINIYKIVL